MNKHELGTTFNSWYLFVSRAALVNTEWLRGVKIRQLARLVVRAICKLYALTQLSGSKAVAAPDQRVGVVHAQATQ